MAIWGIPGTGCVLPASDPAGSRAQPLCRGSKRALMKTVHPQPERQISLDLARDWAALGAEVRRRAAIMAVVDQFLVGTVEGEADGSVPTRLPEGGAA